jgi:GNAT superfamily N-acetyltransferase
VVENKSGELVASLILKRQPDALLVWSIAVHPDIQGKGVGQFLLAHAETEARRQGLARMTLYTNARRTKTIAYYTWLGYRETHQEALPGRTLFHMDKPLA